MKLAFVFLIISFGLFAIGNFNTVSNVVKNNLPTVYYVQKTNFVTETHIASGTHAIIHRFDFDSRYHIRVFHRIAFAMSHPDCRRRITFNIYKDNKIYYTKLISRTYGMLINRTMFIPSGSHMEYFYETHCCAPVAHILTEFHVSPTIQFHDEL